MEYKDIATWYKRRQRGYKIHSYVLNRYFKTVRVEADLLYRMNVARNKVTDRR